tara:strand:- start:679 stop:981 length:303 start_codon:yes stop_codon:yes gene_type:complete
MSKLQFFGISSILVGYYLPFFEKLNVGSGRSNIKQITKEFNREEGLLSDFSKNCAHEWKNSEILNQQKWLESNYFYRIFIPPPNYSSLSNALAKAYKQFN